MGVMPEDLEGLSYAEASQLIDERKPAFTEFKREHGSKPTTGKQLAKAKENGFDIPPGKHFVRVQCTAI